MEKINSTELANKSKTAGNKIREGQEELANVKESVRENMDVLAHEASMDYLAKLQKDLTDAVGAGNNAEAQRILKDIFSHQESMKEYAALARENVGDYIDSSTGKVNMEKFEKELNAFMAETFVIWYGKEDAKKAKISMSSTPLSEMDYEKLSKSDSSKFGEYTINPETAGMNYNEKQPKVKILNEELKQFVGKSRSEVAAYVVKTYGAQYHIPGIEYEKFLLENPDKVPKELKDGNWYHFMGSTLRGRDGSTSVPCVDWGGGRLRRGAGWLGSGWDESDRVLLLEK